MHRLYSESPYTGFRIIFPLRSTLIEKVPSISQPKPHLANFHLPSPVCINQIHCRYKFHLIECSDSCFIQEVRPRKSLFFQSFLPVSLLLIDGDTYNLKTFFAILCIQLLQVRNLFPTRVTPRSPEVNQYIFFSLSQCRKSYFLS